MKPISAMKNKWLACGAAAILLGSATFSSIARAEPVVQTVDRVNYVSGGVGKESLDRLTAQSSEFNLKLIFAMNSGEFVSGVKVVIADAKGKTLVDAVSEGPWFLTRLPVGKYEIVASLAGKTEKRHIELGATKLMTIDFRWAAN